MLSFFNGFILLSLYIPIYKKCSMCKHFYTNPSRAICKKFVQINDKVYSVKYPNNENIEYNLFLSVEEARFDDTLCGINANYYEKRIHQNKKD